jgi:hypothetical protein
MGTGAVALEINWQRLEADHSPPSSAEVKNEWSYTSIPPRILTVWCSVRHRVYFNFTLTFT